ncbi:hypothetical protein QBC33DRAFT_598443 [Phialemonium atrogriseum]|uniref:Uncharacterized protein n=1 Tax=Phialemonium atrogriseum TaxID=1093897 RepID=A0AAJ0BUE4_9PEZI|nr:uncharacterized protein QBC33DRAFT_598443 [Phialemonium atrogriseum]KAK1763309.1 hypothetical protein QBC33DRAFT_598443 [Phialemonium atrogriseum]
MPRDIICIRRKLSSFVRGYLLSPESPALKPPRAAQRITIKVPVRYHLRVEAYRKMRYVTSLGSMVHLAAAVLNLEPPTRATAPGSLKRPRDKAEVEERTMTHKRQKKAWAALGNLQKECHRRRLLS